MNCHDATTLVPAYVDGELDAVQAVGVERHLVSCPECASRRSALLDLRGELRSTLPYHAAPESLRSRLAAMVPATTNAPQASRERARWLVSGAALGCAASILTWFVATATMERVDVTALPAQAVANHVRASLGDGLIVVASSDRHTVKPWLTAHLDFAPPVKDLSALGFGLDGGRVDTLDGQPVAVLVYRYRDHRIGVFVRPTLDADQAPSLTVLRGFNVVHARGTAMDWWAVSDLNAEALTTLVTELARRE